MLTKTQRKILNEHTDYVKKRIFQFRFSPPLDAEDCTSYVLEKLVYKMAEYNKKIDKIIPFLNSVTTNLVYDYYRSSNKQPPKPKKSRCSAIWTKPLEYREDEFIYEVENIEQEYWISNRDIAIAFCINDLSKKDRNIILLYYYDNLTETEIARILGVSQQDISYRLHRALDSLKSKITKRLKELEEVRSEL